jgi:hypothetical protein
MMTDFISPLDVDEDFLEWNHARKAATNTAAISTIAGV